MTPPILYLLAGLLIVIGSAIELGQREPCECEEDGSPDPFGFNVVDGGVVDGGESEWED